MEQDNPRRLRPRVKSSRRVLISFSITSSAFAREESAAPGGAKLEEGAELAEKLQNSITVLISVPFQSNFEYGPGPGSEASNTCLTSSQSSERQSSKMGTQSQA